MIIRCQHERSSSIAKRTLQPVAVDSVRVQPSQRGIAAEEEVEVAVGAGAVAQLHLAEADVVADRGAPAARAEHVAVRQNNGFILVGDVENGVALAAEADDRRPCRPVALAGDLQVGVAAGVGCVVIAIGDVSDCVGEEEGVFDGYVAAPGRFRAHGSVVGGQGRSRVAMGGGDVDGEEDEEEDGEKW
ncbi:hypothetical protein C2845_PM08G22530 [Panicum miliaceum]|uniref:Uncharacterized protein n=1 Tax=Panicum miliaceum TaxID=4540 RepID=A0A3L6R1X4_PANMI|nr:hypothetical protein C2845_PM08G22530 [Panicum miliaceum]